MKCYKNILSIKYFSECIGGLIIFILLIIEIICTINYFSKGLLSIKIYIFEISEKYINYISPKKEHKRNIKNIPHFFTKNEIRNQKTFEKDRNLITDNNIMKIEKEIQKQYKKERDILVYKQKTKKN